MRLRTPLMVVALVAAAGLAALLLAEEKVEPVGVRSPDGEWIGSVAGPSAEVWAVGDANPPNSAKVARLIRRADPDRILYLGDVYPTGTAADFERWAKPLGGLVRRMAPTPGNHEWVNASEGYEPFWRRVTGETPPSYYAFRAGGWDILSVNSEQSRWRPARNWLRDQTRSGGDCRVVFWHTPLFSAGKHPRGGRRARKFWEAVKGRARIVVNGHDHNLQRMKPRDGTVEFIAGAGGRFLYDVDEDHRRLAFSDDKHYAALQLGLASQTARWRFVTAGGRVVDRGSLSCRA